MAAMSKLQLLAAVCLGLAWSAQCFQLSTHLLGVLPITWQGHERRNLYNWGPFRPGLHQVAGARSEGLLAGRVKGHSASKSNMVAYMQKTSFKPTYSMEELRGLEHLPAIRSRDALRSASADQIITAEVFAQLQDGWCVIDDVISPDVAASARAGAETLRRDGFLYRLTDEYAPGRQDDIMPIEQIWKEEWGPVPAEFRGLDDVCKLIRGMAGAIAHHAQPLDELSWLCAPQYMQLACFAAQGRGYVRHLDNPAYNDPSNPQFREGREGSRVCDRRVTALLYFNEDWTERDGGYLRLFSPEQGREEEVVATLKPQAGRLVLFDSTRYFHEVMPAFRERWALSAWMSLPAAHPAHSLRLASDS